MILHTENIKESTGKSSEVITKFNKFEEYKINIEKSTVFLCITSEQFKIKIRKTTPFTIEFKKC